MAKRALLLSLFFALLSAETLYFAGLGGASLLRWGGERAFFKNNHLKSWDRYQRALSVGGDRGQIETDLVELLLFGLDQAQAGVRVRLPLPVEQATATARALVTRRILETPYSAYLWSLAADVYRHAAWQRRRSTPIDLSRLSDDPLENLLPEEWRAIAALETSVRLEPTNYIYADLLAETFLEIGSSGRAALPCRQAVAAYPVLDGHRYLARPGLPSDVMQAALQGFDDALGKESLVPPAAIECDAGRLLALHGNDARAADRLRRAVALAPDAYDPPFQLALACYRLKDYRQALQWFERAATLIPAEPWPNYNMGLIHLALREPGSAIEEFKMAREKEPHDIRFFRSLGETLESLGRTQEAERQFRAAADLNPAVADAWAELVAFYVRHGDSRQASEVCSRIAALKVGSAAAVRLCASLAQEGS